MYKISSERVQDYKNIRDPLFPDRVTPLISSTSFMSSISSMFSMFSKQFRRSTFFLLASSQRPPHCPFSPLYKCPQKLFMSYMSSMIFKYFIFSYLSRPPWRPCAPCHPYLHVFHFLHNLCILTIPMPSTSFKSSMYSVFSISSVWYILWVYEINHSTKASWKYTLQTKRYLEKKSTPK